MSRNRFAPAGARILAGLALMLTAVGSAGCGSCAKPADTAREPQTRSQALIDAGNQAYRAGNYGLAARRYAAAAEVKSDDPAAYYGLGMALAKLGRDEEARKAYARARLLTRNQSHP
ncbi:MAG TPA: tetratricopeptide repeat protein [Candidatus Eisenbacteria bacterium]|jgi:Flp pilus assembly protein TadD